METKITIWQLKDAVNYYSMDSEDKKDMEDCIQKIVSMWDACKYIEDVKLCNRLSMMGKKDIGTIVDIVSDMMEKVEEGKLCEDALNELFRLVVIWFFHLAKDDAKLREDLYDELLKEEIIEEDIANTFSKVKGTQKYLKSQIDSIIKDIETKTGYVLKQSDKDQIKNKLIIEFSDKLKCRKRGQANILDIVRNIKKLNKKHPLDEWIMEMTADEGNVQQIWNCLPECMGSIRKIHDEDENVKSLVDKIIADYDSLHKAILLGEFDAENMKIILYRNNILLNLRGPYWARVESVFAHELFHAYHQAARKEHEHYESENEIVSESLAKYYEHSYFDYLCHKDKNVFDSQLVEAFQKDIRDGLAKYSMDSWPYSGAIYIAGMHEQWSEFNVFANLFYNSVFSKKGTTIKLLRNMNEMIIHKNQNHC